IAAAAHRCCGVASARVLGPLELGVAAVYRPGADPRPIREATMTTTSDIALASIEDVAKQIASKEISPVELTETMLRRIERLNPQLNVYITVTADDALEEARVAQKEIGAGKHRGPLHGVPIAVKDLFATKGVRTTAGSKLLSD